MSTDNRRHSRLPVQTRTFIELEAPAAGSTEPGRLSTCRTRDVSRGGLDLSLAEEVALGAILQIGVDAPDSGDTLYLTAEVKWCRASDDERLPWAAGLKLLNNDASDLDRWVELLQAMES